MRTRLATAMRPRIHRSNLVSALTAACAVGTVILAALVPGAARADEGAITVGVAGGVLVTDALDVLGSAPTLAARVGYEVRENAILELNLGVDFGKTRAQPVSYLALKPRFDFRGILIDEFVAERDPETNAILRMKRAPIQPFLVAGVGLNYVNISDPSALAIAVNNPNVDLLVEAGPGVQVPIGDALMLRTDFRALVNFGTKPYGNHGDTLLGWEWTLGADVVIGGAKDTDGDGISDKYDDCVDQAEDVDGFEDIDGCPDNDNDADGIADAADTCPNEAEDVDTFEDDDGCPDTDNDADGIVDADDSCPLEAGVETAAGCPDADADGITDVDDACADLAGPAELGGCPDTDEDTVVDPDDECPEVAGPVNAFGCPDADGDTVPDIRDECPDEAANEGISSKRSDGCVHRVFVTDAGLTITEMVFFDSGRATIQRRSNSLLDDVAAVLLQYPAITKVEVQGHTDDRGDDARNLTLSQDRAEAVVAYLTAHDVAAERLEAKGYGETTPVADNSTSAGRTQNRRVAFSILEQEPAAQSHFVPAPAEPQTPDEAAPVE